MKVCFLDIDGCLNSMRSCYAYGGFGSLRTSFMTFDESKLDPVAVKLVQRLVEETDAKIVISSSWRILAKGGIKDFDFLELPIIDFTPDIPGRRIRGDEIKKWLDEHPEVESYVILDDDSDMLEEQVDNFVHTDADIGLDWEDYCKAYEILMGEMNTYDPRRFK